jgi:hypothetical protein
MWMKRRRRERGPDELRLLKAVHELLELAQETVVAGRITLPFWSTYMLELLEDLRCSDRGLASDCDIETLKHNIAAIPGCAQENIIWLSLLRASVRAPRCPAADERAVRRLIWFAIEASRQTGSAVEVLRRRLLTVCAGLRDINDPGIHKLLRSIELDLALEEKTRRIAHEQ